MAIYSKLIEGLTNGEEHFVKVFTVNHKSRVNNRIDLPVASAVPSEFPEEPTSYDLIGTYTSSQIFTAPETGYYQIDVHGASGNGGSCQSGADYGYWSDGDRYIETAYMAGGGGGGGSGFGCSRIKLNKGDTVKITIVSGGNTTVEINSTADSYPSIIVTPGDNGTSGSNYGKTAGKGGKGGISSGGTVSNLTGNAGANGNTNTGSSGGATVWAANGGSPAHSEGNTGGKGGYGSLWVTDGNLKTTPPTNGQPGFIKIYRGDTNIVA